MFTIANMMEMLLSRHTDPRIVICDCGWSGQLADARHGYAPVPPDDVEPMDYCPRCGGDIDNMCSTIGERCQNCKHRFHCFTTIKGGLANG
jgi:hypothetical protein